jgi:hypothetical protein
VTAACDVTVSGVAEPDRPHENRPFVETASRLRFELATVQLFEAFEAAGVEAVLLKGPAITQWLYLESERRGYLDVDLLVGPKDLAAVEEILAARGYARDYDDRSLPSWWREHASAWVREDGLTIDLHRRLGGIRASEPDAWRILSRDTEPVVVAGREVPALRLAARALHVVVHAAHHGADWEGPTAELERALAKGDEAFWRGVAALAEELDAMDAFAAGLHLTESGRRLAQSLELAPVKSVEAALYASTPPPIALGFEQLAQARGLRARLVIMWHKAFPPAEFIRHWDPRAARSRSALARAYVRRPFWLARHAPEGMRAWRNARRSVRRRQS